MHGSTQELYSVDVGFGRQDIGLQSNFRGPSGQQGPQGSSGNALLLCVQTPFERSFCFLELAAVLCINSTYTNKAADTDCCCVCGFPCETAVSLREAEPY